MALVSFTDYTPAARYDGIPWITILIEEAAVEDGPWTQIDSIAVDPIDVDPTQPKSRSFTTDNATIANGWYRVSFTDVGGNRTTSDAIHYAPVEILASTEDINAQLDNDIISADLNNTNLIQASVARVIRANLSQIVDTTALYSWATPETTPEVIREIAGKLIAARLYMAEVSRSGQIVPNDHYAVRLYNEGMDLLRQIISGTIVIPNVIVTPTDSLTDLDYFPVDDTDRAFTLSKEL